MANLGVASRRHRTLSGTLDSSATQLIKAFGLAFSDLETQLRMMQNAKREAKFYELLTNHRWPQHAEHVEFLRRCGDLRNYYSHGSIKARDLAVPLPGVTERLIEIVAELQHGPKISDRMAKPVTEFQPESSLYDVLEAMQKSDFSQFPIRTAEGGFRGLLTDRRIAAWLARERVRVSERLHYQAVQVMSILQVPGLPLCYSFAIPDTPVRSAILTFSRKPDVEALLVTESGNGNSPTLGIFTLWDVKRCIKEGY